MTQVPDRLSLGAMLALGQHLGRPVGASTGTNLVAVLQLAAQMRERRETGSIVTLLCDDGSRYANSCHDAAWRQAQGLACDAEAAAITRWMISGEKPAASLLAGLRSDSSRSPAH
jgi:cysteine synthase A